MSKHTPRLYANQDLAVGDCIQPEQPQAHHLLNVLRMRDGDEVRVFNGKGGEYTAIANIASKRDIRLELTAFKDINREAGIKITLAQGIARGERMDYAIQKAVELGATTIQPLHTEKSQRIPANRVEKKLQHWQAVAQSAAEQSGRTVVPVVLTPENLGVWLNGVQETVDSCWLLDPESDRPLRGERPPAGCVLLIGPESGLTENECENAQQHGFTGIRLGPRVLRTETAGVAAIAAIQALWGDFA